MPATRSVICCNALAENDSTGTPVVLQGFNAGPTAVSVVMFAAISWTFYSHTFDSSAKSSSSSSKPIIFILEVVVSLIFVVSCALRTVFSEDSRRTDFRFIS